MTFQERVEETMKNVTFVTDEDGWIVAQCPLTPGCISQGRTQEEAMTNIREAIEVSLEDQ